MGKQKKTIRLSHLRERKVVNGILVVPSLVDCEHCECDTEEIKLLVPSNEGKILDDGRITVESHLTSSQLCSTRDHLCSGDTIIGASVSFYK